MIQNDLYSIIITTRGRLFIANKLFSRFLNNIWRINVWKVIVKPFSLVDRVSKNLKAPPHYGVFRGFQKLVAPPLFDNLGPAVKKLKVKKVCPYPNYFVVMVTARLIGCAHVPRCAHVRVAIQSRLARGTRPPAHTHSDTRPRARRRFVDDVFTGVWLAGWHAVLEGEVVADWTLLLWAGSTCE